MSDEERSYTSILLPGARVALFTTDDETQASFQGLESDWRFARVKLETVPGDVETAIQRFSGTAAPDLIIIQTESIDASFTDRLEALAEHLTEHTSAIIIGPVNDVNLYRRLVSMGVSDYLVKPVPAPVLAEDIAQTLLEQIGASDSRLIALLGSKGGVGVSVLSEALAWSISGELAQKTFLLDAAGGWSTLSVGMDFEPSTTLPEAVRAAVDHNEDSLTRMIYQAGEKLFVLSSGGDVMLDDSADAQGYETLLGYLMGLYPVVIVDLSGAPSALKRTVLTRAHQTLLVTAPTLPSVRATRTLLHEIKDLRGGNIEDVEVVTNMVGYSPKFEVPKAQIGEALERPPTVSIPFDTSLFVSTESEALKLYDQKGGDEIVKNLLRILEKTLSVSANDLGGDGDKKGGIGQLLSKLKTKS
ncbi:MAG: type II secretion protein ATPase [Rhodospirillales bacterium]|nr:type II secretion protein ATPase [Rhodospirillales bacterium]MCB9994989.1 type II secretion protein ATPase [Rhodospirillales bacterium]